MVRTDGAAGVASTEVKRTDCGPGGCGPAPAWGSPRALEGLQDGLAREAIDYLCREQLMRTIVNGIVDDAMTVRPKLSGEGGELTPCVPWLARRGYFEAQRLALVHARRYGGGAVVCFIDDGKDSAEEVDLLGLRDVEGFMALPKWNCVPADAGSPRVRNAWYGPRVGRPEHYVVAPDNVAGVVAGGGTNLEVRAGQRFHRSRIIPFPYVDELSLRQARLLPHWSGWGPGVVESVAAAYLSRRSGALRVADIMNSLVYNVLTLPDVMGAMSTPDGGSGLRNVLDWIRTCLEYTGGGLPVVAVDRQSSLEPKSHTVSGISDLLAAQRTFLLDCLPEYVEVRLWGSSATGMAGDKLDGQWRAYYGNVASFLSGYVWTAGTFGGGMRQAVMLAQACPCGPTSGEMDPTVEATWPSLWKDSEKARAETRKLDAEARALDAVTLGLTPDAFIRHDPTVQAMLPSLDVDDGPLPQPNPIAADNEVGALVAQGEGAALSSAGGGGPATTPAKAIGALGEEGQPQAAGEDAAPTQPAAPAVLPADIHTEAEIAKAYRLSRARVRQVIQGAGLQPALRVPAGTAGGDRYSLSAFNAALERQAAERADGLRKPRG